MSHGIHLSKAMCPKTQDERDKMNQAPYAMLCTRPDVAYALSICSRYQADPGEKHWIPMKNILKYLRRTKEMFLVYGEGKYTMKGFMDASFQSDHDDFKSQSRFIFCLNGGAMSWKSSNMR